MYELSVEVNGVPHLHHYGTAGFPDISAAVRYYERCAVGDPALPTLVDPVVDEQRIAVDTQGQITRLAFRVTDALGQQYTIDIDQQPV